MTLISQRETYLIRILIFIFSELAYRHRSCKLFINKNKLNNKERKKESERGKNKQYCYIK